MRRRISRAGPLGPWRLDLGFLLVLPELLLVAGLVVHSVLHGRHVGVHGQLLRAHAAHRCALHQLLGLRHLRVDKRLRHRVVPPAGLLLVELLHLELGVEVLSAILVDVIHTCN